jgi:hypothetical protein
VQHLLANFGLDANPAQRRAAHNRDNKETAFAAASAALTRPLHAAGYNDTSATGIATS